MCVCVETILIKPSPDNIIFRWEEEEVEEEEAAEAEAEAEAEEEANSQQLLLVPASSLTRPDS